MSVCLSVTLSVTTPYCLIVDQRISHVRLCIFRCWSSQLMRCRLRRVCRCCRLQQLRWSAEVQIVQCRWLRTPWERVSTTQSRFSNCTTVSRPKPVSQSVNYKVSRITLGRPKPWPCGTVPDLRSPGRRFDSRPWLLCTNANSACHPFRVG